MDQIRRVSSEGRTLAGAKVPYNHSLEQTHQTVIKFACANLPPIWRAAQLSCYMAQETSRCSTSASTQRRRSDALREASRLLLRTQNVNLQKPSATRSKRKLAFAHCFPVPTVSPSYSPFVSEPLRERFVTTVRQLNIRRSPKSASERTPRTDPPRRGQDYECVCALDQEVVVDVIAVNNPLLTSKEVTLFLEELALWHPDPAGIPAMKVETDDGEARLRRQHP